MVIKCRSGNGEKRQKHAGYNSVDQHIYRLEKQVEHSSSECLFIGAKIWYIIWLVNNGNCHIQCNTELHHLIFELYYTIAAWPCTCSYKTCVKYRHANFTTGCHDLSMSKLWNKIMNSNMFFSLQKGAWEWLCLHYMKPVHCM